MADHVDTFLTSLEGSIQNNSFVKLTLGAYRGPDKSLRKIVIRLVALAKGNQLSFVYRHATKDVTKNLPVAEGLALIRILLGRDFFSGNLFATTKNIELCYDKMRRARLRVAKSTHAAAPSRQHNRSKKRLTPSHAPYLHLLGVTNHDASVKKGMEAKFRQINKFVEIIESLIRSAPLHEAGSISVLDMGCGKGYLTFAMYDYLNNGLQMHARVTGVEARKELVDFCNSVAHQVGFTALRFECGSIRNFISDQADVLIALHACDTATDEALFKAITSQAALVLCAPCCHQELRPQMRCAVPGLDAVLQSGILLERQAEVVTDGLRALLLEAFGYKTSVFEFIATEHTSKNVMIAGIKTSESPDRKRILEQVEGLKTAFGIKTQYLEALLAQSPLAPGKHHLAAISR
jgi:SAM-dependent methyltransferase